MLVRLPSVVARLVIAHCTVSEIAGVRWTSRGGTAVAIDYMHHTRALRVCSCERYGGKTHHYDDTAAATPFEVETDDGDESDEDERDACPESFPGALYAGLAFAALHVRKLETLHIERLQRRQFRTRNDRRLQLTLVRLLSKSATTLVHLNMRDALCDANVILRCTRLHTLRCTDYDGMRVTATTHLELRVFEVHSHRLYTRDFKSRTFQIPTELPLLTKLYCLP
jgi:hypothetical protein